MIKIGDFELHLICDCSMMTDPGGVFGLVPRVLWSRYIKPSEDHLVPMVYHCLLIKAHGNNIVVDTGFGDKLSDKMKRVQQVDYDGGLLRGLAKVGLSPEDIDLVIDTHLHSDHCSGNTRLLDDGDTVEAVFPNAEYVVQRREYEDAMQPNERTRATYFPFNYEPLVRSGQMRLLEGDTEFLPGIAGIVTPGHTPAHMSVRIESNGEHAAFICDMASYAIHFERLGWMTAYDVEPLITLETKRRWQNWALETNALLIFPHDSIKPAGRFTITENGHPLVKKVDFDYV